MRLGIVPSFQKSDTLRKSSVHEFAIVKKEKEKKKEKSGGGGGGGGGIQTRKRPTVTKIKGSRLWWG